MAKLHLKESVATSWFCGCLVLSLGLTPASAQYEPDWLHQLRIGPMVGLNISADFSMRGQFSISGNQPGPVGVSGANHIYDDGYVRVDQTGNAQGFTSFWGYNSAAQFNAANHTLLMHSASSFTTSQSSSGSDDPYFGFEIAYGASPWRLGNIRVGFDVGFGFLPISIKDNQPAPAVANRNTFSFDTGTIVLPTAPYNGGSSGIGPTIHDVATAVSSDTISATVGGSHDLDVTLLLLRIGPTLYWDLSQRFGLSVGAGPAVGIMPGDLKFNEVITFPDGSTASNQGKVSSTQFTFGGYVGAQVMFHLVPHGDIYLGAQFTPLASKTFEGSGREARLNLQGQVLISAGLNWPF